MRNLLFFILFALVFSACVGKPIPQSTVPPIPPSSATTTNLPQTPSYPVTATGLPTLAEDGICNPQPIVVPTIPAKIPAATQLDETSGLHMTGTVQIIELASYRLKVSGKVDRPLNLTFDELRCMPKVTASAVLSCAGVFTDSATWSGVPIIDVLDLAGVQAGARTVELVSADGFKSSIDLVTALDMDNFLAYEMTGKPLPILHGFPVRAVLPGEPGGQWVKWLVELVVK
jgi:DMSO/TMAO reductase YedYZ molybdopterin-dependent catalytic subunit